MFQISFSVCAPYISNASVVKACEFGKIDVVQRKTPTGIPGEKFLKVIRKLPVNTFEIKCCLFRDETFTICHCKIFLFSQLVIREPYSSPHKIFLFNLVGTFCTVMKKNKGGSELVMLVSMLSFAFIVLFTVDSNTKINRNGWNSNLKLSALTIHNYGTRQFPH